MKEKREKIRKDIGIIVRTVIFLLMGIQIVLGLLWSCKNLTTVPFFVETNELEEISRNFLFDDYSGFLYPVMIYLAGLIECLFKINYGAVLYLLQLGIAFFVYTDFQRKVFKTEDRKRRYFFALYVITVPTVLQCHMAVLQYSLVSSAFIWMMTNIICLWREKEFHAGRLIGICAGWMISAALLPDYAWIGGILAAIGFAAYMALHRKFAVKLVIAMVFTALSLGAVHNMTLRENPDKIQRTVGAAMVSRFVWPNFLNYSFFWSHEVRVLWDTNGLFGLAYAPEQVIYEFGPKMEQAYGREYANDTYWAMAKTALGVGTKAIMTDIVKDFGMYVCPPASMYMQLQGEGRSYTGWNYGRMIDHTPVLAKTYVTFSLKSWFAVGILSVVYWLLCQKKAQPEKREKTEKRWKIILTTGMAFVINIWYVMSKGHMLDYRYVIVISILWAFAFVRCINCKNECEDQKVGV